MPIEIRTFPGKHFEGDKVVQIRARYWTNIDMRSLLRIVSLIFENEDRKYPQSKGGQGRWKLVGHIWELAHGKSVEEILQAEREKAFQKVREKFNLKEVNGSWEAKKSG